ncbi:hypothetical protein CRG98_017846 [Punica granatum]|uniref:Extensin-like n=1 Tax=Punica granatum TaxID=22663 RepID=A0A2I0JZH9_PUNGR|nr:hypothetical protein CRG98_017846 [Punica granatum]
MPTHSQTPLTQAMPPPIPADISTAHSGVPIGHPPPPTAQTTSNLVDSARFTALEGMVNQLATNMATNMTELITMLRDHNRASLSFTPPQEHMPTVDPNPVVPPIHITDSEDISFLVMVYVPAVHPISDPLPPPSAPTVVPLPPAAYLSADSTMHVLPPLTMPVRPPIYIVPPPTVPPQVQLFHSTRKGAYYSHLLAHTSSFSDLIEAGKKLDMGVKLGIIEGPSRRKDGEASKRQTVGSSKKGKDAIVGTVNSGHQASQPISVDYTPALQTSQAYAHLVHYTQLYQAQQAYSSAPPTIIHPLPPQQYAPTQVQQGRAPASRSPQPTQRAPAPQAQQNGTAQPRQRKQYTPLPAPPSHIFRQLFAGNKINTEAPGPNFDPAV